MLPSSIIKQLRSLAGNEDEFIYQYHQVIRAATRYAIRCLRFTFSSLIIM
jgi:hypothetical protein